MSEAKETIEISLPQMLDLIGGVIGSVLISSEKEKSKSLFKDLKQGKQLELGKITYAEKLTMNIQLTLDYSEFAGPGFNYDVFKSALAALLNKLGTTLKAKQEIKLMGSDTGVQLVAIPGVVFTNEQGNVLMLALDFTKKEHVVVQLMFMDPAQFLKTEEGTGTSVA